MRAWIAAFDVRSTPGRGAPIVAETGSGRWERGRWLANASRRVSSMKEVIDTPWLAAWDFTSRMR